jgi:hypothetical protein
MAKHFYQISDIYPHLKHPEKYKGRRPVTMRSSWESKFVLQYLDINSNIVEWSSEEVVIPYICGTDGKQHRYFMDFWVKAATGNGKFKELLIEVKPYKSTVEPVKPKRITKGTASVMFDWVKNSSKWKTTRLICEQERKKGRDIEFVIISERDCPWFLK